MEQPPIAEPGTITNNNNQQAISPSTAPPPQEDLQSTYKSFSLYPFDTDPAFQTGLASILGQPQPHPDPHSENPKPPSEAEKEAQADLILEAQCFYYAHKFNISPFNPREYKAWKSGTQSGQNEGSDQIDAIGNDATISKMQKQAQQVRARANSTIPSAPPPPPPSSSSTSATASTQQQQQQPPPPYPTSFAAIVDLITNNKPIPGIEEIPETVLEHGSSRKDTVQKRRKPWEKDDISMSAADTTIMSSEVHNETAVADAIGTTAARSSDDHLAEPVENIQHDNINGDESIDSSDPVALVHSQLEHMDRVRRTGVGVMHILSPDAVPDSGLIAKD